MGCSSIPSEPTGKDVLSEINDFQRILRQIARLDTFPDTSILTTVDTIQKKNAKKAKEAEKK
jgi:hypothetical protein